MQNTLLFKDTESLQGNPKYFAEAADRSKEKQITPRKQQTTPSKPKLLCTHCSSHIRCGGGTFLTSQSKN